MAADQLTDVEIEPRIGRLRQALASSGVEAMLVSKLVNVRYLTGFTGSAAQLVVGADSVALVTDGRYESQARAQLAAARVDVRVAIGASVGDQDTIIAEEVAGAGCVGLEDHVVTWASQRRYQDLLEAEVVPAGALVEELRRTKDAGEVARVRAACAIGDEAFAEVEQTLRTGATEQEVALALEFEMRRRGASAMSFAPIVAAGPNGAMPHARPSQRPIGRAELVVMDFGCVVDGYCSDMTRTVSVGDPDGESAALWELVRAAQAAGRASVAPGATCAAVDAACRDVIAEAGHGDHFTHSTGHGVGLEIHEEPFVRSRSDAILQVGDVVTVEPGVYLPGVGGVRLEDTLVVTERGAESLTLSPKEMVL